MKRPIIADIKRYISFLKNDFSLYVSLHSDAFDPLISSTELLCYNIHTNPYCLFLKGNPDFAKKCINCQKKVFNKCPGGELTGVCHAGVFEFIYPFEGKGDICGFISVSGYQSENKDKIIEKISSKYSLDSKVLYEIYSTQLSPDIPDKEFIDTLIRPLVYMLELAYGTFPDIGCERNGKELFYLNVLHYLNQNRSKPIELEDICRELYCSKSYISHNFKKYNGKTINEYLNYIRIKDAEMLLANTELNITQIALQTGFSSSNYFTVVFKKLNGCSPLSWRSKNANRLD